MKILRNRNFGNFEILEDFQNFEILKFSFFVRKKSENIFIFSKIFFWSWKKYIFKKYFYVYKFKISSGFQKSYLENRAMSLSMRKIIIIQY